MTFWVRIFTTHTPPHPTPPWLAGPWATVTMPSSGPGTAISRETAAIKGEYLRREFEEDRGGEGGDAAEVCNEQRSEPLMRGAGCSRPGASLGEGGHTGRGARGRISRRGRRGRAAG